jgi:hypothetical protein
MSKSPWMALNDKPYVLAEDRADIDSFNSKLTADSPYRVEVDVVPEPFIGSPNAPIWLLNLNPGFAPRNLLQKQHIVEMQKKSARLEASDFWFIDPQFSDADGYKWWTKRLRKMREIHKIKRPKAIQDNFFCAELFPYHSTKFKRAKRLLESQRFTVDLVKAACHAEKHFIIMRAKKYWLELVPELDKAHTTELKAPEAAYITPNNLKDPRFVADILSSL